MPRFAQWLEANTPQIRFTSFWKDGTVVVYINDAKYVYITDAAYHDRWKALSQHRPFAVLNQIKTMVNKGFAKQIEPSPELAKPTQQTLF